MHLQQQYVSYEPGMSFFHAPAHLFYMVCVRVPVRRRVRMFHVSAYFVVQVFLRLPGRFRPLKKKNINVTLRILTAVQQYV